MKLKLTDLLKTGLRGSQKKELHICTLESWTQTPTSSPNYPVILAKPFHFSRPLLPSPKENAEPNKHGCFFQSKGVIIMLLFQ